MKKTLLSFLIIIFSVTPVFSQFSFGIKAGLNVANAKSINSDNNKARLGFNGGVLSEVEFGKKIILRPELLYSVKGCKFPATAVNTGGTLSLNYFSVPILGGYHLNNDFTFLLGPEFNFLTKANSKFDNSDHDVSSNFRKFDIAIDLGAAYNLKSGLGVELRYSYGFKDLVDVIYTDQMGNVTGKGKEGSNRVVQIGLFYKFHKK
ncbi:MAG: PorT family protein [Sphingobacteriales bacterium]|nr:PorT family protein [Sphingobacteriales bacterium]MBI3720705.1 PorT family protein [Sphingobacteriales bacterium]